MNVHNILPFSQRSPSNPGGHVQLKSVTPGIQVAPFWHGPSRHKPRSENKKRKTKTTVINADISDFFRVIQSI